MKRGTVIWLSDSKGYGFIRPEGSTETDKDLFCHYTGIDTDPASRRKLLQGQIVEYQVIPGHRGPIATAVRVVT